MHYITLTAVDTDQSSPIKYLAVTWDNPLIFKEVVRHEQTRCKGYTIMLPYIHHSVMG